MGDRKKMTDTKKKKEIYNIPLSFHITHVHRRVHTRSSVKLMNK